MLQLYEQTKPPEQQVAAAIKKRNRTKFRWGTSSTSTSSSSSTTRSSFKSSTTSASSSSRDPSHPPKSSSRRSSLYARPPKQKPTLSPIVESELEDHVSDDERDELGELEHLLLLGSPASCSSCSSASSSLSLPAGSQYAALSSPNNNNNSASSFTSNSNAPDAGLNDSDDAIHNQNQRYKPRVEYNLRKLLRQVMGLDGLWTCDQQVARHYARIKWGVVKIQADGNCLFRAISDQLYGSEAFHGDIRRVRVYIANKVSRGDAAHEFSLVCTCAAHCGLYPARGHALPAVPGD